MDVEWGRRGQMYPVAVHIDAWDRVGLLRDVSTMVAEEKVNMVGVHTQEARRRPHHDLHDAGDDGHRAALTPAGPAGGHSRDPDGVAAD